MDYGDAVSVTPLARSARGTAAAAASRRMQTQVDPFRKQPHGARREQAIPSQELETTGPVDLRKRLPPPAFPPDGDWNGARLRTTQTPQQAFEEDQFTEYQDEIEEPAILGAGGGMSPMPSAFERRLAELQQQEMLKSGQQGVGRTTAAVAVAQATCSLRPLVVEDVDQLWDWIRTEPDRAQPFFGEYLKSALALHQKMQHLMMLEQQGEAAVRAIVVQGTFIGLALLWPVNLKDRIAQCHLYFAPPYRHIVPKLLGDLVTLGERLLPPGVRLAVYGNRDGWAELLTPLGFVAHTMLIRER